MVVGSTDAADDPAEVINRLWAERQKPKLSEKVTQPAQNHALGLPPTLPGSCWHGLFADYRELVGPTTEAPDAYHFTSFAVVAGAVLVRLFINTLVSW
jgi:hypothetical protein